MLRKISFLPTLLILAVQSATAAHVSSVPARTNDNLIVASYNIKWLGQAQHDLEKLAQVIQHFDVCGILEVKGESAVADLVAELEDLTSEDWGYVYGVRTHRPSGTYHEAYAAVWRRDRVEVGDGITSNVWDLEEAFRNDPYIVTFQRNEFDFCLLLIHTRWSDDDEGTRADEVWMIGQQIVWMQGFMIERDDILAGDFNYPGDNDVMLEMATEAGLLQLDTDEKSTFKSNHSGYASAYDHMYVIEGNTTEYVDNSCRVLDVTKMIYGSNSTSKMKKSKQELSDHLPVFAVFSVSGSDDD